MDLLSYQRAFMRMSFAAEPSEEDLAQIGSREAALSYRHMIRTRLLGMAKVAFKASMGAVGEQALSVAFARYMAEVPPRSALIREVIADFGSFARNDLSLLAEGPGHLRDVLTFEESKWRLGYALSADVDRGRLRELDFERAPLWNPTLRILSLAYPVHTIEQCVPAAEACTLFMYRPPTSDEVRWYRPDDFFAELARGSLAEPERSFGELVPSLAAARKVAVDQALLESLATALTLAVERGVLLGVLDRS